MLEQEATLLTQVLARGARNDPFLVLVTLGRASRERSSAGTDFSWPLGMAQCLGLAGTPVLLEGSQGFVPGCCCCKSRGLGELPGLEERAAWSCTGSGCSAEPGWPQSRGWQGQGQTVALICGQAEAGDIPGQERLQLCSSSARAGSLRAGSWSCTHSLHLFPFFFCCGWELTLEPAHRGHGQTRCLEAPAPSRN